MPNSAPEAPNPARAKAERADSSDSIALDGFPPHTLFALFDNRDQASAIAKKLESLGVESEYICVLAGPDGALRLQPDQKASGFFDKLVQLAQELSDFKTFIESCSAMVKSGKALLLVRFETEAERLAAERAVAQGEGQRLAYTEAVTLVKFT